MRSDSRDEVGGQTPPGGQPFVHFPVTAAIGTVRRIIRVEQAESPELVFVELSLDASCDATTKEAARRLLCELDPRIFDGEKMIGSRAVAAWLATTGRWVVIGRGVRGVRWR